jgi:hypothetical protein
MSTTPTLGADRAAQAARQASNSRAVNAAARAGFVAKGLVYALIGVLAIQVAFGHNARTDQKGALHAVAQQPAGELVLWLMVIGFAGYALWRFSEAIWGRREESDAKKRTVKRLGSAANGLVYLCFGVLAFKVATGSSSSGQQSMTAKVLNAPGGQTIVVIAGLVIIAIAIGLTWRGLKTDFEKHLNTAQMSRNTYTAVRRLGQVGYICRGIVFALVGVFVIKAAMDHQPGKAQGFNVAMKSLLDAPGGPVLLAAAALGLICFGAYCLAEARYRRL